MLSPALGFSIVPLWVAQHIWWHGQWWAKQGKHWFSVRSQKIAGNIQGSQSLQRCLVKAVLILSVKAQLSYWGLFCWRDVRYLRIWPDFIKPKICSLGKQDYLHLMPVLELGKWISLWAPAGASKKIYRVMTLANSTKIFFFLLMFVLEEKYQNIRINNWILGSFPCLVVNDF